MLYIHGLGHFHPENCIDNEFLEALDIGIDSNWVIERVGIHSRRTVLPLDYIRHTRNRDPRQADEVALHSNATTGAHAARMAMARAGVSAKDIGMVISGGCAPHYTTPAEASIIAAELNIEAPAFDLASACSSFGTQLHFLNYMQPEALPRFILLVNSENNTRTVNYNDRRTAILWGDASSAAVVSKTEVGKWVCRASNFRSDPAGWNKVRIARGGHFEQDGSAVQKFAISKSVSMLSELHQKHVQDQNGFYFIGHQGNLRLLSSVCRRSGIDEKKHLYNVHQYGNGGAAGAPSVFSENWDRFNSGDRLYLVTVGAGLAWNGIVLEHP